jgi:hypothetical protein
MAAICGATIEARRAALAKLILRAGPGLQLSEYLDGNDGATVFEHACKLGLEGIVSKRRGSRYVSGRSPDWVKLKNPNNPAVRREAEEDWGITGFAYMEATFGGKWLELLSEIAPGLKRAAIMFKTAAAFVAIPSFETAAQSLKVVPIIAQVHSDAEIEAAIIALGREPGGGLVVASGGLQHALIITATARTSSV